MSSHEISVHFTEVFLRDSSLILCDSDLKIIAVQTAEDPLGGRLLPDVPNLRVIDNVSIEGHIRYSVWYLHYPDVPHVEIIAFSESEVRPSIEIDIKTVWKIIRFGMLLRSAYRAYRFVTDHVASLF